MSKLSLVLALLVAIIASFAIVGCNSEPPVTEGDAPIIKDTPKNLNPPAKALREKMGAGPSKAGGGAQAGGKIDPPPSK